METGKTIRKLRLLSEKKGRRRYLSSEHIPRVQISEKSLSISLHTTFMSRLHLTVLPPEQSKLFPLLRAARKRSFYLVWGTAIALHIWHRRSIDFDLFRIREFSRENISIIVRSAKEKWDTIHLMTEENITGVISGVKITFFHYPFPIEATVDMSGIIRLPDLISLAAMKAYALGRRAKWKDYVDLYFIIRDHYSIHDICQKSSEIYDGMFSSRQFREQLCYFEWIDYRESVEYLIPDPPSDEEVKAFLIEKVIED